MAENLVMTADFQVDCKYFLQKTIRNQLKSQESFLIVCTTTITQLIVFNKII